MHRITLTDPLKIREAFAYAQDNHCEEAFNHGFMQLLSTMAGFQQNAKAPEEFYGEIRPDFHSPHSFNWWVGRLKPGQTPRDISYGQGILLVGGLVHHSSSEHDAADAPGLAVRLGRDAAKSPHEWTIHT